MAKPPQPWDRLPTEAAGDPTPEPIFEAVGVTLTAWERMNDSLGALFGVLVNSRHGAAEAAFGWVESPAQRATMIMSAAERIYRGPEQSPPLAEIGSLLNNMTNLAAPRNDVAHGIVSSFTSTKNSEPPVEWGHFLIPRYTNTKKQMSNEALLKVHVEHGLDGGPQRRHLYAYTSRQVLHYASLFNDHRRKIVDLLTRVQADILQRWPPQEFLVSDYEQKLGELQTKLSDLELQPQQQSSDQKSEEGSM